MFSPASLSERERSWMRSLKLRYRQGHVSSDGPRGRSFLVSSSSWGWPAVPGPPWLVDAPLHSLPPSSRHPLLPVFSSLLRTVSDLGPAPPIQHDLISGSLTFLHLHNSITSEDTFSKEVLIHRFWVVVPSGGPTIQAMTNTSGCVSCCLMTRFECWGSGKLECHCLDLGWERSPGQSAGLGQICQRGISGGGKCRAWGPGSGPQSAGPSLTRLLGEHSSSRPLRQEKELTQ